MLTRARRKMMSVFSGAKFVGAHQQIQRIHRPGLIRVDLRQQVERLRRIGLQFQRAIQNQFGFRVIRRREDRLVPG